MKNVYITIGLPSCGKTTWMKDKLHGKHGAILDADMVCKIVNGSETDRSNFNWVAQVHYQKYNLLLVRDEFDHIGITNTSLTVAKRQQYWLLAKRAKVPVKFTLVYFDISADECIRRQEGRDRKVPHDVIYKMEKEITMPSLVEMRNFGNDSSLIYVKD